MKRIISTRAGALVSALLLTACSVGPDYKKPDVAAPNSFRYQIGTSEAGSFADQPWWNVFNDKVLQQLIHDALLNNTDLHVAFARVEESRAQVGVVSSEGMPQIGYQGDGNGAKTFVPGANTGKAVTYGVFEGLLSFAWEFDLWGRIQHATDAAKADLLGQQDVQRGVMLMLVSDLAANYFSLLELDRELTVAKESAGTYKKTLDLFTARFESGKDSKLPVERAQAAYDSSTASIHDLTRRIAQTEDAISTLLGSYPKDIPRGNKLGDQTMPETPVGTTTALLQRRPDIMQAEEQMIAANQRIGEAVADFFPRIGLSALIGGQEVRVGGLPWTGFGVWSAALSAAGPIYSGGRLESAYHQRQAFWDESIASYKQKVLVAFQETADALKSRQTLPLQRAALDSQVAASQRSADIALLRYNGGRASYFEVLEAQQQLYAAQNELAKTERDQLIAVVNLYKALGGGWTDQKPPESMAANATGGEGAGPLTAPQ